MPTRATCDWRANEIVRLIGSHARNPTPPICIRRLNAIQLDSDWFSLISQLTTSIVHWRNMRTQLMHIACYALLLAAIKWEWSVSARAIAWHECLWTLLSDVFSSLFQLQINFLLCQILALLFASFFRSYLHPSKVSANVRHAFGLSLGLYFGYFCFGQQAIHIAGLPTVCYMIIRTQNPQIVQR